MSFPETLAIASRNAHKVREFTRICADWPVRWLTAQDGEGQWPEVAETGATYEANARLKAHAVAEALHTPAIADDSGIEVDALGGRPGPLSARYSGPNATDAQNLSALLSAIAGIPPSGRTARYRCVVVTAWPDGSELVADGTCEGSLGRKPRGERGFGYDPIFVPAGWDRTMAELTDEEKDRISHRGRALRAMRDLLSAL